MNSDSSSAISTKTHWIVNGVVAVVAITSVIYSKFTPSNCGSGFFIGCEGISVLFERGVLLFAASYIIGSSILRYLYSKFLRNSVFAAPLVYFLSFILALPLTWGLAAIILYIYDLFA